MTAHRRAIEARYKGLMTVTVSVPSTLPDGTTISKKKQINTQPISCYLQRSQNKAVATDGFKSNIDYNLKVMFAPEVDVPAGSTINVRQDGMNYEFEYSGETFKYPTHQEITMNRVDNA